MSASSILSCWEELPFGGYCGIGISATYLRNHGGGFGVEYVKTIFFTWSAKMLV